MTMVKDNYFRIIYLIIDYLYSQMKKAATGITGIFLFHMVENIGMVIGLLPITGVPLPFVSYGGSSLLITMMGMGILLNISRYER